jgi:hypothetical protein
MPLRPTEHNLYNGLLGMATTLDQMHQLLQQQQQQLGNLEAEVRRLRSR